MRFLGPLLMLLFLALPAPVQAVNPDEVLDDPALETRARAMSRDLRCVVCRNQSIDDSNAGIARDMRIVLRERLLAGDTDAEVIRFMVDRYGAFILLKPPLTAATLLLWISPVLLLVLVVLGFRRFWRQPGAEDDLSDEDRALVRRLLEEEGGT